MNKIILFLTTVLFVLISQAQQFAFKPRFSTVFDTAYGQELLHTCSRIPLQNVSNFWVLSKVDTDGLEQNFGRIYGNTGLKCCYMNSDSLTLNDFGFQYLGIVINRQKFIYVNAFYLSITKNHPWLSKEDLSKTPVSMCDGGNFFWGVLYSPEEKNFSQLQFDGHI